MAKGKKPTPQEIYWERKRREEREKAALLPAGFVNHGNTCFMNSILQGLVATRLLEDLLRFRSPMLPLLASRRSPVVTNGRGPREFQQDWVQGMALGDAFIQILERSWGIRDDKERKSLSPKELLSRLGAKYDQYLDFRQQDAHEFLLHLLDGIRMEEFDVIKQRQPPPPPKPKSRSRAPNGIPRVIPDPIREEDRLKSFVDMTFGGRLASVLVCENCKHVSHTYEDFDDLSLSITHDESKERMRDRLRTFASKFISSSNRSRGQTTTRPPSFSQPPSPPLPPTTLDIPEDAQEAPRRRSLEDPLPLDQDIPKIDIFTGFGSATGVEGVGDTPTFQPRGRPRIASDAGLGKIGRRISASMALSGKRDKKPSKVDRETKADPAEGNAYETDRGVKEEKIPVSVPTSRPPSRQLSPTPSKQSRKEKVKPRKLSEHDKRKAVYLRRLLEDPTVTTTNPLAALRAGAPIGPGINAQWSKVGSVQSIEDCLKMFTAVEVLDGDNMVGCRNCWKIANGLRPDRRNTQSDADTASSEDDDEKPTPEPPQTDIVDPVHSSSMPNFPLGSEATLTNIPHHTKVPQHSTPPEVDETGLDHLNPTVTHTKVRKQLIVDSAPPPRASASEPGLPIPMITAASPQADVISFDLPSTSTLNSQRSSIQPKGTQVAHLSRPFYGNTASSRDSLQLPSADTHRHRGTHRQGGLSSDESDDTSGISDGDTSAASNSSQLSRSRIPRSKQVVLRRALKRYLVASPPPILVVHLKRFQQVSKSPVTLFSNLKKLDEYVSFPEYLDIRPFLYPKKEDYGLGKGELRGKVLEKGKRAEDIPCGYRLYAVVVHIGNMLGGHYIAYTAIPSASESSSESRHNLFNGNVSVGQSHGKEDSLGSVVKKERQWTYISDTVVRLASLDEVLKSKAYICMYERLS